MARLVASDLADRRHRHTWTLEPNTSVRLGRQVPRDQLRTAWDEHIADAHAVLELESDRLHVTRRSEAPLEMPIFYNGENADDFLLVPGEGFVIGRTVFRFEPLRPEVAVSASTPGGPEILPADFLRTQLTTSSHEELQVIENLLKVPMGRDLDIEAFQRQVVAELKRVIRPSDQVAILYAPEKGQPIQTLVSEGSRPICDPLVQDAWRQLAGIQYRWGASGVHPFPQPANAEWAFCVPIACDSGYFSIYLSGDRRAAGKSRAATRLNDAQRALIQIAADMLQSVRALHDLQRWREQMQQFFPKPLRDVLLRRTPAEAMRTEQTQAAILFCDLRGSSRFAERKSGDLMSAWDGIKEALSVMTVAIANQNGCIGDFQGDAAMAFWGWPRRKQESEGLPEDVTHACQAADKLRERFLQNSRDNGPLADLACGIGIAAGDVIAGMLGTKEQRKVGVFGPAVNLAARLESMTKQLGVSILLDERAEAALRSHASARAKELASRLRYLATIEPAGMTVARRVFELLPDPENAVLSRQMLDLFESGRTAFENGNWREARKLLQHVRERTGDGASKFLIEYMDRTQNPPVDWDGRVVLTSK